MEKLLLTCGLRLSDEGKIIIPDRFTKIKLDIGLSYNAPYSNLWVQDPERIVFGFEPNPECAEALKTCEGFTHLHYRRIDPKYVGKQLFIIPAAIDITSSDIEYKEFYMTSGDPGTSSLYKPITMDWIKQKTVVPCISLESFLNRLDFSRIKYIEHIKIDAQGNDLRILKSAGSYLEDKVIHVTVESSTERLQYNCNQIDSGHTQDDVIKFMTDKGFIKVDTLLVNPHNFNNIRTGTHGANMTFRNTRFNVEADCSLIDE